ncbi:MAG: ATPase [Candidatus Bathyarchaeia archaeon]
MEVCRGLFDATALAMLGGALALIGGIIGSCIGILIAASAGVATITEEPGQFRNVLVLASLPMTQTFYGFIVLLMILTRALPKLGAAPAGGDGMPILFCALIAAAAELISAVYQGKVCASGISLLPKSKGRVMMPSMMLAVYLELFGVLGMVFSILAMSLLGFI